MSSGASAARRLGSHQGNRMRFHPALIAAALVLQAAPALAYDTPTALIDALYAPYLKGNIADESEKLRSRALQALYAADEKKTPKGYAGALDFDPFISGQDFKITNLKVVSVKQSGSKATVEVTFKNFDEKDDLVYSLVKEPDGWKIDDVASVKQGSEYRLTKIFHDSKY